MITKNQARIMVYLSVVHNTRKYLAAISDKLEIEYGYTMRILRVMALKGWVGKHKYSRKMFYFLKPIAPLPEALYVLSSASVTMSLTDFELPDGDAPEGLGDLGAGNSSDNNTMPAPDNMGDEHAG